METNQRLAERLSENRQYGPEDVNWYYFVRDHKKWIKRKSKVHVFTPEELVKYRYRPTDFFVEECKGPSYMTWIFLFINDIREASEFNENRTKLTMISPSVIEELHQIYSVSANCDRSNV